MKDKVIKNNEDNSIIIDLISEKKMPSLSEDKTK